MNYQRLRLFEQFGLFVHSKVCSCQNNFLYRFDFCSISLIRSGAAVPFTAYAGSPTVTMPRLKAITTGSVPSFLDVILNIAESDTSSTLAHQDTWLAQIKAKKEQLILYGDDTWLKLFPGMFSRSDGTTSFFVSVSITRITRRIPRLTLTRTLLKWTRTSLDMSPVNLVDMTGRH
jgi:hypothetical protein